jgi:hypothetical protein
MTLRRIVMLAAKLPALVDTASNPAKTRLHPEVVHHRPVLFAIIPLRSPPLLFFIFAAFQDLHNAKHPADRRFA